MKFVIIMFIMSHCLISAHAEEYTLARDEIMRHLIARFKVPERAELTAEESKQVIERAVSQVPQIVKEILPEKISTVSKRAADLMLDFHIDLLSADQDYLHDTLTMYISAVLSQSKFQRVYPTLTETGLAELRANISSLTAGLKLLFLRELGHRVDLEILEIVLAKAEKSLSAAIDNPNVTSYRIPIPKDSFNAMMRGIEARVKSDLTEIDRRLKLQEMVRDPRGLQKGQITEMHSILDGIVNEAAGSFSKLTTPPELSGFDIDTVLPGHNERIKAFNAAQRRVRKKLSPEVILANELKRQSLNNDKFNREILRVRMGQKNGP